MCVCGGGGGGGEGASLVDQNCFLFAGQTAPAGRLRQCQESVLKGPVCGSESVSLH